MSKRAINETSSDENPAKSVKNKECPFEKPWKGSDAVLVVEGRELHVHTTVLALGSPVFEAMFNGSFKEAETKRVVLEGKSHELVEYMLKIVYNLTNRLGKYYCCHFDW